MRKNPVYRAGPDANASTNALEETVWAVEVAVKAMSSFAAPHTVTRGVTRLWV